MKGGKHAQILNCHGSSHSVQTGRGMFVVDYKHSLLGPNMGENYRLNYNELRNLQYCSGYLAALLYPLQICT